MYALEGEYYAGCGEKRIIAIDGEFAEKLFEKRVSPSVDGEVRGL